MGWVWVRHCLMALRMMEGCKELATGQHCWMVLHKMGLCKLGEQPPMSWALRNLEGCCREQEQSCKERGRCWSWVLRSSEACTPVVKRQRCCLRLGQRCCSLGACRPEAKRPKSCCLGASILAEQIGSRCSLVWHCCSERAKQSGTDWAYGCSHQLDEGLWNESEANSR